MVVMMVVNDDVGGVVRGRRGFAVFDDADRARADSRRIMIKCVRALDRFLNDIMSRRINPSNFCGLHLFALHRK